MSVSMGTDANNVSRLSSDNSSSFVGVVGGGGGVVSGGGDDASLGTTVPFTFGNPGFLSGLLFLEGPFRACRWVVAF